MPQDKRQHVEYQRHYFDSNYEFFRQPIPAEIEDRTRMIVQLVGLHPGSRVLDVGTGMGVLIKHFLEEGVKEEDVVGADLSEKMLTEARKRFPHATFWKGDIAEFKPERADFDAVFFNACFGNIFDQDKAVEVAAASLRSGGAVVISHPLGNDFVEQLRTHDPKLVLTLMPTRERLLEWCERFGLQLQHYRDVPDFFLAILRKP